MLQHSVTILQMKEENEKLVISMHYIVPRSFE
jgi:hypothetical protein